MDKRKSGTIYLESIDYKGEEKAGICEHFDELKGGDIVLEIGPGSGVAIKVILDKVLSMVPETRPKLVILDLSAEILRKITVLFDAVNVGLDEGEKIDFAVVCNDAFDKLPFKDGEISAINISSVLHEGFSYAGGTLALDTFIIEVSRVLRINGFVVYRDPEGPKLNNCSSFYLKTPDLKGFTAVFLKKYFQQGILMERQRPNSIYRADLLISLDGKKVDVDNLSVEDFLKTKNVFVKCLAGLGHEIKRHFVVFMKTFYPEVLRSVEDIGHGKVKYRFEKPGGTKFFSDFCHQRGEIVEYQGMLFVSKELYDQFEADLSQRTKRIFDDPVLKFDSADNFRTCLEFFGSISLGYTSNEENSVSVRFEDLVLVYDKLQKYLSSKGITPKMDQSTMSMCDWFEREGQESYFYGDEIDVIVRFFRNSLIHDSNSVLGLSCLIPISSHYNKFTHRDYYTNYVAGTVADLEGGYVDGKRNIHFVKRPIEYALPVLLKMYEKTNDARLLDLIRESIKILYDHLGDIPIPAIDRITTRKNEVLEGAIDTSRIIGLAGGIASGKSTLCEILKEAGYAIVEISECIRDQLAQIDIFDPSRNDYYEIANAFRHEKGPQFWAEKVTEKIPDDPSSKIVISGIRTIQEVDYLRQRFPNFVLLGVDAPRDIRVARVKGRGRNIDPTITERIITDMNRELEDGPDGCQLKKTFELCDTVLDGSTTISDLRVRCLEFLESIKYSKLT